MINKTAYQIAEEKGCQDIINLFNQEISNNIRDNSVEHTGDTFT